MNEHEMCCGTTCDKQAVAEEFERLAERNRTLEALLKLAILERDEALAYAERLQPVIKNAARLMRSTGNMSGWHEKADKAESMLSEQPSTALAVLKAQWQVEQYGDGKPAQKAFWDGFERGAINGAANIRQHWNEYCANIQRAQEAGDGY